MTLYFDELPGWCFEVREVSAGTYAFTGFREGEKLLELTGTDTTELTERSRREAMEREGEGPGSRS